MNMAGAGGGGGGGGGGRIYSIIVVYTSFGIQHLLKRLVCF
jgi:hypothetical protein